MVVGRDGDPDARGTRMTDSSPISVLLVDDDPDCRLLVRDAIADSGIRATAYEVGDAEAAMRFLQRRGEFAAAPRPALIYMDVEMPGIDGIELVRRVRADVDLRDIPIVMMTGVSDDDRLRAAAAAGANSYTIKPADAEQFLRTVAESAHYWLTVHQFPGHHLPADACRR
jgi:CheY-like chemotaxis protein